MSSSAKRYTKAEEAAMRAKGMRPVTIWVPDLANPAVAAQYRREVKLLAEADAKDSTIESFSEAALADLDLPPYEER